MFRTVPLFLLGFFFEAGRANTDESHPLLELYSRETLERSLSHQFKVIRWGLDCLCSRVGLEVAEPDLYADCSGPLTVLLQILSDELGQFCKSAGQCLPLLHVLLKGCLPTHRSPFPVGHKGLASMPLEARWR